MSRELDEQKCVKHPGADPEACELTQPLNAGFSPAGARKLGDAQFVVEAKFYRKLADLIVKCELCPRGCTVRDGERGFCGVRENRGGTFHMLVHSRCARRTPIPSRRSPSSITCRERTHSRWLRRAAMSAANSARTGSYPSRARKRFPPTTFHRGGLSNWPGSTVARLLPTLTASQQPSANS